MGPGLPAGVWVPVDTRRAMNASEVGFDLEIGPQRGWFDWRLGRLWRYRDLVALLVWRDFVSVHKQTALGPAWHIVRPLLTTLTFTIIFGSVARLSTDGTPPFLFYMAGNVAWTYFATCLDSTAKTFVDNSQLLGKVYFHRLVIPVSIVASSAITFGIQLAIFVLVLIGYMATGAPVGPTGWIVAVPLLVIMLAGYGLGAGIIVCAFTAKYRDLRHVMTFGVQLLMYLTPVIYPISAVPPTFLWLARLNPLTPIIEGFRRAFLGSGTIDGAQVAVSFAVMLVVLLTGMLLFTRAEQTFMDTV
jgi:lipopolysaccharide transport system permease protein